MCDVETTLKNLRTDRVDLTTGTVSRHGRARIWRRSIAARRELKEQAVIAMKTVWHVRESDLVRYALSLEDVCTAVVGLDTLGHLQENARMVSGVTSPWDRPGYDDQVRGVN